MDTRRPDRGPLPLTPRLDAKLWGGRRLERHGFDLPDGTAIGEAVVTSPDAVVRDGPLAGASLDDLIQPDPLGALGERGLRLTGGRPLFPLLVKWIDASTDLSIQVHPDDARAPEGTLGKTEAWFVVEAEGDAALYVGLADPDDLTGLAADARAGRSVGPRMRRVPAIPGQVVFLPAGTVHALGAGVLVYEIQQHSFVTYRLDDWGRVDDTGAPRELHVEEAIAVANPALAPDPTTPVARRPGDPARPCVLCPEFALELIELGPGETMTLGPEPGPAVFTTVSGDVELAADAPVRLRHGETAALLAGAGPLRLSATLPSRVLRGWVP